MPTISRIPANIRYSSGCAAVESASTTTAVP
jgi:hypothetical protein